MGLVADWGHVIICFGGGFVRARSVFHRVRHCCCRRHRLSAVRELVSSPGGWWVYAEGGETRLDFWMILPVFARGEKKKKYLISSSGSHVCKPAADEGSNTCAMALNHRHYPEPHCCAIPALKRLYTVPVRLHWGMCDCVHIHECSPGPGENVHFRRIWWAIMAAQQTAAPVDQELIVSLEVKVWNRVHLGLALQFCHVFPCIL